MSVKEFTVPMALTDLVPVILFLTGNLLIWSGHRHRMSRPSKVIYLFGVVLIVAAGFLKALYKLLYAAGAGDFEWMNRQFFTNQSVGFLLAGIGLTFPETDAEKEKGTFAVIPTMALVGLTIIGELLMYISLCRYALKMKKAAAAVLLGVSFILSQCMGYLSSHDFSGSAINWIAQAVNIFAQGTFCGAAYVIRKASEKSGA